MVRGGRLKERDPLFEIVLKWITHSEVTLSAVMEFILLAFFPQGWWLTSVMEPG
jgi:hypothetical protein